MSAIKGNGLVAGALAVATAAFDSIKPKAKATKTTGSGAGQKKAATGAGSNRPADTGKATVKSAAKPRLRQAEADDSPARAAATTARRNPAEVERPRNAQTKVAETPPNKADAGLTARLVEIAATGSGLAQLSAVAADDPRTAPRDAVKQAGRVVGPLVQDTVANLRQDDATAPGNTAANAAKPVPPTIAAGATTPKLAPLPANLDAGDRQVIAEIDTLLSQANDQGQRLAAKFQDRPNQIGTGIADVLTGQDTNRSFRHAQIAYEVQVESLTRSRNDAVAALATDNPAALDQARQSLTGGLQELQTKAQTLEAIRTRAIDAGANVKDLTVITGLEISRSLLSGVAALGAGAVTAPSAATGVGAAVPFVAAAAAGASVQYHTRDGAVWLADKVFGVDPERYRQAQPSALADFATGGISGAFAPVKASTLLGQVGVEVATGLSANTASQLLTDGTLPTAQQYGVEFAASAALPLLGAGLRSARGTVGEVLEAAPTPLLDLPPATSPDLKLPDGAVAPWTELSPKLAPVLDTPDPVAALFETPRALALDLAQPIGTTPGSDVGRVTLAPEVPTVPQTTGTAPAVPDATPPATDLATGAGVKGAKPAAPAAPPPPPNQGSDNTPPPAQPPATESGGGTGATPPGSKPPATGGSKPTPDDGSGNTPNPGDPLDPNAAGTGATPPNQAPDLHTLFGQRLGDRAKAKGPTQRDLTPKFQDLQITTDPKGRPIEFTYQFLDPKTQKWEPVTQNISDIKPADAAFLLGLPNEKPSITNRVGDKLELYFDDPNSRLGYVRYDITDKAQIKLADRLTANQVTDPQRTAVAEFFRKALGIDLRVGVTARATDGLTDDNLARGTVYVGIDTLDALWRERGDISSLIAKGDKLELSKTLTKHFGEGFRFKENLLDPQITRYFVDLGWGNNSAIQFKFPTLEAAARGLVSGTTPDSPFRFKTKDAIDPSLGTAKGHLELYVTPHTLAPDEVDVFGNRFEGKKYYRLEKDLPLDKAQKEIYWKLDVPWWLDSVLDKARPVLQNIPVVGDALKVLGVSGEVRRETTGKLLIPAGSILPEELVANINGRLAGVKFEVSVPATSGSLGQAFPGAYGGTGTGINPATLQVNFSNNGVLRGSSIPGKDALDPDADVFSLSDAALVLDVNFFDDPTRKALRTAANTIGRPVWPPRENVQGVDNLFDALTNQRVVSNENKVRYKLNLPWLKIKLEGIAGKLQGELSFFFVKEADVKNPGRLAKPNARDTLALYAELPDGTQFRQVLQVPAWLAHTSGRQINTAPVGAQESIRTLLQEHQAALPADSPLQAEISDYLTKGLPKIADQKPLRDADRQALISLLSQLSADDWQQLHSLP